DRRDKDPIVKRYENPQTRISDDEEAQRLRSRQAAFELRDRHGELLPPDDDETLKARLASAYRTMDREYESTIFLDLGLDKTPKSDVTRHELWWWIAHPLVQYLEPLAPRRKEDPRVTPDAVFAIASKLLNLRSNGLWPDRPDLLKSRYYYAL